MGRPSRRAGDGTPGTGVVTAATTATTTTAANTTAAAAGGAVDTVGGVGGAGPAPRRPLRADARRNRDAVLTAAAEAFAREGVQAPLEEIARSAGVGVGTLYRHFPTREALVFGVYAREVELLAGSATQLAAELGPAEALREWMLRYVRYAATKRGLLGMLRTMMADDTSLFDRTKAQIAAAAESLLAAAVAAGEIRPDVRPEDLTRSIHGVCMASSPETAGGSDCAARLVGLVFDGLRYGAPAAR